MAKYRVEAQILIIETIEADDADEACKKMDEILQNDYADLDWNIEAYIRWPTKRTLKQWEYIKGINIIDYDGFDRKDEKLMERYFTEEEFDKGVVSCTLYIVRPKGG